MNRNEQVREAVLNLLSAMRKADFRGRDPYDALQSPVIVRFTGKNNRLRFYAQQVIKRFPFDTGKLLNIQPQTNPVTLALALQGVLNLERAGIVAQEESKNLQKDLTNRLKSMQSTDFPVACWGYPFDWEARYASIPANYPTVVSTGIVTNALFQAWKATQDEQLAELIIGACRFVTDYLNRTIHKGHVVFSYSPSDREQVLNASGKAVRILAQGYAVSGDESFRTLAADAASAIIELQRPDGSWPYSMRATGGWIDNYHTGYLLDCLNDYSLLCRDNSAQNAVNMGLSFYVHHFFNSDGSPKLFHNLSRPVDCTAAGQSLLTLTRFGKLEAAEKTASYMIENLRNKEGRFYYRKHRFITDKRTFMRWSDAWMLAGLSALVNSQNNIN
jgi:rhamnogalacturonyl hydrolase YesR